MAKAFVILSPGFPADENDSTCLPLIQSFVSTLKKEYLHLDIVVLTFQYPFSKKEYYWNGIKIISFNGKNKGGFFRLIVWMKVWNCLKEIKKNNELIGLLSLWLGECALIGTRFGKKYSIKHYCWLQGQDAKKGNRYVGLMKPASDELIAISDFLAQEFYRNYLIPVSKVIASGIDVSMFNDKIQKKDIDILGAGSLIPLKRYDLFVDIIAELNKIIPSLRVIICGKGFFKQKLKEQIKRLALNDTIILAGELPHSLLLQLMKRSKIFLHTSEYEGYSTVCAEALYAGARVISFCKPMNVDIENWNIVENKNEVIVKCIALLADDDVLYNSVLANSIKNTANQMMQLFDQ